MPNPRLIELGFSFTLFRRICFSIYKCKYSRLLEPDDAPMANRMQLTAFAKVQSRKIMHSNVGTSNLYASLMASGAKKKEFRNAVERRGPEKQTENSRRTEKKFFSTKKKGQPRQFCVLLNTWWHHQNGRYRVLDLKDFE